MIFTSIAQFFCINKLVSVITCYVSAILGSILRRYICVVTTQSCTASFLQLIKQVTSIMSAIIDKWSRCVTWYDDVMSLDRFQNRVILNFWLRFFCYVIGKTHILSEFWHTWRQYVNVLTILLRWTFNDNHLDTCFRDLLNDVTVLGQCWENLWMTRVKREVKSSLSICTTMFLSACWRVTTSLLFFSLHYILDIHEKW